MFARIAAFGTLALALAIVPAVQALPGVETPGCLSLEPQPAPYPTQQPDCLTYVSQTLVFPAPDAETCISFEYLYGESMGTERTYAICPFQPVEEGAGLSPYVIQPYYGPLPAVGHQAQNVVYSLDL